MKFACAHCRKIADKPTGAVNRARKAGLRLFCGRRCAGLGRRAHKTTKQRREEKRLYDAGYRIKNRALLKAKKHAYYKRTYDPAKARVERKARAKKHVEYCRRPEYRKWKREYDLHRRAAMFGAFAQSHLLLLDLTKEINTRITDYEKRKANETLNKKQARSREAAEGYFDEASRHRHRPADGRRAA